MGLSAGVPWHTIRSGDGSWQTRYDVVPTLAGSPPAPIQGIWAAGT